MRREPYLKLQNIEYRNALRDIRISTHKLNIELGRYENIERSQRLCKTCDMKVTESEEHFLLECPTYEALRIPFFTEIRKDLHLNLKQEGIMGIKYLFEQDSLSILHKFGKFLKNCWAIRNATLENA